MKTIVLNQVGFNTNGNKRAVLNFAPEYVKISSKNKVYEKNALHFGVDDCSGEDTYVVDFSDIKEQGIYWIEADEVKSVSFEIADKPYDRLMKDLCKCFYYLRCNGGLEPKFAGVYSHGKCHTAAAKVFGEEKTLVDVSGGWHDAGDYGRYTTAGAVAAAHLLYTVMMFPELKNVKFDIPSDGNLPDILAEIKVELKFLMKMQREDGAAWHKVTTMRHADFVMPEEDVSDLYLFPVSSIATADLAAVCALASTIYREYDEEFSNKLLETAKDAYEWLSDNPGELLFRNPPESNTGEYGEAEDISNRFWAALAMFRATGDEIYKKEAVFQHDRLILFDKETSGKPDHDFVFTQFGWAEVAGLGSLDYLLEGYEDDLTDRIKTYFVNHADRLVDKSKKNGYGVCMEASDFIWGSNMELGKYLMVLTVANRIKEKKEYSDAITQGLDYLLGCNAMDVSYVTGNGEKAYKNPHLRPTAVDGIELPWPGLVSGGPNKGLHDEKAKEVPAGTAPMKCYLDDVACYSLNEITIYWNSPIIFALAREI